MRLDIELTTRSPLFKTFTRSVCFGCTAAMILALVNTAVPVVGLRPNGMFNVSDTHCSLPYRRWCAGNLNLPTMGRLTLPAQYAIWLTAFFALIGSVLIDACYAQH